MALDLVAEFEHVAVNATEALNEATRDWLKKKRRQAEKINRQSLDKNGRPDEMSESQRQDSSYPP